MGGPRQDVLADDRNKRWDDDAVGELLLELKRLRDLDVRLHAHAPGTAEHEAASAEVDAQGNRVMDRFRDIRRNGGHRTQRL
jgi:hypothetical protein